MGRTTKTAEPLTIAVVDETTNLTRMYRLALSVLVATRSNRWSDLGKETLSERVVLSVGQQTVLDMAEDSGLLEHLRVSPRVLPAVCQHCGEVMWSRAAADVRAVCEMTLGCEGTVVRVLPPTKKELGI